jgi:hypothetical protein
MRYWSKKTDGISLCMQELVHAHVEVVSMTQCECEYKRRMHASVSVHACEYECPKNMKKRTHNLF